MTSEAADSEVQQVLADPGWRRLHPVTPVLRAWKVVAVVLVVVAQQGLDNLLQANLPGWILLLGVLGGLVVVGIVTAVYSAIAWRRTRYRIDADAVHIEQGVLWRRQRQAQLDRLQAVDLVRPLLGRLFGLAELRLEVAGGAGSKISLAYLKEEEAQRVRNALLAAAAGVRFAEGEVVAEAPQRAVVEVPVPRLLLSTLLSGLTIAVLVVLAGCVVTVVLTRSVAPLAGMAPGVLGLAAGFWARFNNAFGFTVAESPDGLRLKHGLLEQRSQTVPPGRVQALRISQPLLWRRADWWRVHVNVAGYGGEEGSGDDCTVVLPVGTREELARLLLVVLPDLGTGTESPLDVVGSGLTGTGTDGGFTASPRASRRLDPIAWRRHGFRITDRAFLARSGRVLRRLDVVPHERTQSLAVEQGPLQRRLGLASVALHSTPGPVSPRVDHLDTATAAALLAEQSVRARAARAAAGPERWMARGD
ncbi:PH domain-containing protein [Kineococcus rubinsiae]|uniref:PH domain-containing protein n=1 Tax=Kineococcus rubinsiae TaxID=2609562 RepID=UPI00142FE8BF|nr:PH domain-containing protein [Kineococcus rubinsiae]NIZ92075.1 PH domain-containing protein [Kineococcus rubinsiae]